MDLKKQDVAELLTVSINTIDQFIQEGKIPFYTLEGEFRFNRQEIENWMMSALASEKDILPFGEGPGESGPWQQFGLYRAIHKGAVVLNANETEKNAIIRETMEKVSNKLSLDPEAVTDLLMERENLMPTSFNYGIAVPHTREFLLNGLFDAVVIVYPKEPIEWGALDQTPVNTLFFLFACDDKRHLNLLAKIAHFTSSKKCLDFIQTHPEKAELLDFIKDWEESIIPRETASVF